MLGHSHALSGAVAGLGVGLGLRMATPDIAALAGYTAGMALLPDLDKCGSSPARSLGFLSEAVARIIGRGTGGHRHATHSVIGVAIFSGAALLACRYRADVGGKAGLALLMTLTVAGGLEALRITRAHTADLIAIAVAAGAIWYGYGLRLIPLAVLVGCCTHIAGDMLTESGCMLAYPFSKARSRLLPRPLAFTTGTKPELLLVDPLLLAALAVLAFRVADPHVFAHLRLR